MPLGMPHTTNGAGPACRVGLIGLALMLYLTDFSTASKMLNLNNPIQETVRFRSVGSGITLLLSVPKGRDICECGKNQSYVILER